MKIGVLVLVFLIVCVHHESWGQQKPTIKTTTKAAASHKGTSPKPTPAQSGKLVATTAKRGPVTTKKAVASGKSGKLVATTPKKGPVPTKKTVSSDRSGKLVATTPKKGPGVTTKKSTAASGKSGKIVATTPKKAPAVATTKKTTAPKGSGKHVATTTKKRPVAPVVIENKSGNLKAPTTKAPKNQPMKMSTTKKGATTAKPPKDTLESILGSIRNTKLDLNEPLIKRRLDPDQSEEIPPLVFETVDPRMMLRSRNRVNRTTTQTARALVETELFGLGETTRRPGQDNETTESISRLSTESNEERWTEVENVTIALNEDETTTKLLLVTVEKTNGEVETTERSTPELSEATTTTRILDEQPVMNEGIPSTASNMVEQTSTPMSDVTSTRKRSRVRKTTRKLKKRRITTTTQPTTASEE
ncbi:proteoglycan 4-like isoform X1 [Uranotaenia lowii]|uniref:proteoglycan 4-like isoform X1 n=1 Tax=Uranotaenia lowii TaxID=190385 RepID=UPI00247AEC4F|nr:proteoglycan 4-like isoform X1 [Uranotaenia lowii]